MTRIEIPLNKTRMKIAVVLSAILILYGIYLMHCCLQSTSDAPLANDRNHRCRYVDLRFFDLL